jgi:hypothetical protein
VSRSVRLAIFGLAAVTVLVVILLVVSKPRSPAAPGRLIIDRDASGSEPTLTAKTSHRLVNAGGSPVQILGIKTTCGCASAQAQPSHVPPGGVTTVRIEAAPMDVGVRKGVITIETDSPETPFISLDFLVEGDRPPPHLLSVHGELLYRTGSSRDEPRPLFVEVVEQRSAPPKAPVIRCGLPFVRVGEPKSAQFDHATHNAWVVRKYPYQVALDAPPSTEFVDDLFVSHSDDLSRTLIVRVIGEESLPFQVTPRHLRLRTMGGRPSLLIVKPVVAGSKIRVGTGRGDPKSLIIRPIDSGDAALRKFEVSPGPAPIPDDHVVVSMEGRPDRVIVSVMIVPEDRP